MVAKEFQPPPLWGYNKTLKDFDYNPQRAQDLLKEAGFPQGLREITWNDGRKEPLQLWYMPVARPYFPNPKEIAEAIAADLAKVGIAVQLQTTDWTVYLDKRKNGELPFYMLGWTGDNGDPDNFVCYFFCSPGVSREGFYANQPLADALLQAQTLTDHAKRAELYRKAEQMIHDDAARIFIANNQPPIPLQKRVKGYVANPTAVEYFNSVYFSQ
jgi:peptide/nickel transport system substrate-binding protein